MEKSNLTRILLSSFLLILLFLIPFISFVVLNSNTSKSAAAYTYTEEVGASVQSNNSWYTNPESPQFITVSRLAIISLVITFGALGSIISLLSRRKIELEYISNIGFPELIVVKLLGATFAIILMLFFWSGLISGELFPVISFGQYMTIYSQDNLAKLLVWSFIAGFSERLVPQLIENIEKRVSNDVIENNNEKENP